MSAPDEFAERLAELQERLESGSAPGDGVVGSTEVTRRSTDLSVAVTVRDHRVAGIAVHPGLPGRPVPEIKELVAGAVNSALRECSVAAPSEVSPPPDLAGLRDQLDDVRARGERAMRSIGTALEEIAAEVGADRGVSGDPRSDQMNALFDGTLSMLDAAQRSLGDLTGAPVTGTGRDAGNEVEATVAPEGAVAITRLSAVVRSMSPGDFGGALREAVNAALDDWASQRRAQPPGDVDEEALRELGERIDALRGQSIDHLREYTANLSSIMRSLDER